MRDHNSSCVVSFDFKFIFSEIWSMLVECVNYYRMLLLIVDLEDDTKHLELIRNEMMHGIGFSVIICPEFHLLMSLCLMNLMLFDRSK